MKLKLCKKCGIEKPLSEMVKHSNTKDGYLYKCKICALKDRQKIRHYVSVSEKVCCICGNKKKAEEFPKNPRSITGLGSRCKNCSNTQRRDAEYYKTSNELRKLRMDKDPEYRRHINNLKRENTYINFKSHMLSNARKRSIMKNYAFNLTIDDIHIPEICPILKIPIIVGNKNNYESTPSIDRIDNDKGYTKDNIQIISKKANSMKNSASIKELIAFADWVYLNFKRNSPNFKEEKLKDLEDKELLR
jgi:hypothetical protein